jgi:hypothetical protein
MSSQTDNGRIFMASDLQYLLTFAAGMGAFWLSGQASTLLPVVKDRGLSMALGMVVTAAVYGLGMALWTFVLLRRRALVKPLLVATVLAVVLGILAAQLILRLAAGQITTMMHLGLLTFALYLCYGTIYLIGLAVAKKLAKQ